MRKVRKRIVSLLTTALMLTLAPVVSAETTTVNYDSTVDGSEATSIQTVGVEAERAEWYSVTLPKTVTLNVDKTAGTASFDYSVEVSGEVSKNHYIRVIPLAGAQITDESETLSYELQVEQSKKRWLFDEIGTVQATGTYVPIVVNDEGVTESAILDPGKYMGSVAYMVTCDDAGIYTPATCTAPKYCTGFDTDDSGVVEEDEKLETPIAKGKALGHSFSDTTSFPSMCGRCKELVYGISTPEQMTVFKDTVNVDGNNLTGVTVVLCNDIDMSGVVWDSGIGKAGTATHTPFNGTFDGNGYTISNLTINDTINDRHTGIFNTAGANTVIKNVTFYAPMITADETWVDLGYNDGYHIGGLIAQVPDTAAYDGKVTVEKVTINKGNLQHTYTTTSSGVPLYIGGLIGRISTKSGNVVKNCAVYDFTITHSHTGSCNTAYVGGLIGHIDSYKATPINTVVSCIVNTNMTVNLSTGYINRAISGLIGGGCDYNGITLKNCVSNKAQIALDGTTPVNCLTTDDFTSANVLTTLNTDQEGTWVLDLEGVTDGGYPVIKQ